MRGALTIGVLLAGAVGASCGGGDEDTLGSGARASRTGTGTGTVEDDGSPAALCVKTINDLRATLDLAPLARWTEGEECADGQAQSDGETNRPHGAFPRCGELAQNECPGWPGPPEEMIPKCLRAMWAEGPGGGHFEQMRTTRHDSVACGFHTLPSGAVWSVQNFK
jgi:hypothetical protein